MQASSRGRYVLTKSFLAKGLCICMIACIVIFIYYRGLHIWHIQQIGTNPKIKGIEDIHFKPNYTEGWTAHASHVQQIHTYPNVRDIEHIHFKTNYTRHCLSISDVSLPNDHDLNQLSFIKLSCLHRRYVTSLQSLCTNPKRYGNIRYGGFRICMDDDVVPLPGCTIYSYNHPLSKRFTDQIDSNFNCMVMNSSVKASANREKVVDDLKSALLQHSQRISVLIFKLDFKDVPYLNDMYDVLVESKIKQVVLEMHHNKSILSEQKYLIVNYLSMLRKLYFSGYQIYWNDINWEFVQKGKPKCFTVNLYLGYLNKPLITNRIDLPDMVPFGARQISKSVREKYEFVYWEYISHHEILCKTIVRLGNIFDGGWEVCHDVQFRPRSPCIVYSFGINYDFSFDNEVIKTYGCDVYAFDPSMKTKEFNRSNLHFYKIGIGEENKNIVFKGQKWKLNTLKTILEKLNHTNKRIDILKMDIEDNELQTLPEMIRSGAMKNVAQFCLEFHNYYDVGTIRQLHDLGFRIYWSHPNPLSKLYQNGRSYSYGNEVYFVNVNLPK